MKIKFQRIVMFATALSVVMGSAYLTGSSAQAQSGDLLKQVQPNDTMLKKGQELYKANCVSCHGDQGKGDGLAAAALNPKPRNFHSGDNWINGQSFSGLYKTLEEGINGGKSGMNAYSHLSVQDRVALINHVRSLSKDLYSEISAEEVDTLNKPYDLAAGMAASGEKSVLPVDVAIKKLVEESAGQRKKVTAASPTAMKAKSKGAALLRRSTYDLKRALTSLSNADNSWRSSVQDFAKIIVSDAEQNGFSAVVATYEAEQWKLLHNYLKGLI